MSRILRIVLFVTLSLVPFALPAQDASPPDAGAPAAEPTPAPEPADGSPETMIVAPADAMPSDAADAFREDVAAAAATGVEEDPAGPPGATAEPAAPVSRPSLDVPPPPRAPSVEVATGSIAGVEEVAAGRASNWFFLAVLVLAFVLIATRVKRTADETLSIQEERSASPPVPPIVRRS